MSTLNISNIKEWYRYVDTLTDHHALNGAVTFLRKGASQLHGYHPFKRTGELGKAYGALNRRARELNCYRLGSDGTYRPNPKD
ncbi:hypothetical protein DYU11_20205 [Fibrisoma montanum]|uniref:Uncharacterized protein n=1 Tax=Fibrisoma montanum TaxID=2305895 RepID=A0A418M3H3_9BACT|nr:hypothetical protein [Fibrisoma montanum]RIV20376.1 hypothetical protein DYU11_20205 [Fibrisoma montanum]